MIIARPEILRRYYAAALGGSSDPEAIYAGATFDEYYALERIRYPLMSRRTAAKNSPIERFRALESTLPEEESPPIELDLRTVHLARQPALDLERAPIDAGVERLVLDRIKEVSGWAALARLQRLRHLMVILCGSAAREEPLRRAAIERVEMKECKPACVRAVLRTTSAEILSFSNPGVTSFDLKVLEGHPNLRDLTTGAPYLRGLDFLEGRPIVRLHLGMAAADDRLRRTIAGLAGTLEHLTLSCPQSLGPDALPDLDGFQKLGWVGVSVADECLDAWLDYAVAHPKIAFFFFRPAPSLSETRVAVEEIYRGIDILRILQGKKTWHEVSGDLAADFDAASNEALEDRIKTVATRAKKKIQWSSEADTFGARASDVETCRWLIDALHGEVGTDAGEPPSAKAPRTAATKLKASARKRGSKGG